MPDSRPITSSTTEIAPPKKKVTWAHRLSYLALFVVGVFIAIEFYQGEYFTTELQPSDKIHRLDVYLLEEDNQANDADLQSQSISTPYSWLIEGDKDKRKQRFVVHLPADFPQPDHVLYFSAFRIAIDVYHQENLVSHGGNKQLNWNRPLSSLTLDLDPFQSIAATETKPLSFEIDVFGNLSILGGLGSIWYGPREEMSAARIFFVDFVPNIQLANISVLCALLLFLGIDSVLSRTSRHLFALSIPSLCYAVLNLPSMNQIEPILWTKLYHLAIIAMYAFGINIGASIMGILDRAIKISTYTMMVSCLSFVFINDVQGLRDWIVNFLYPLNGILGAITFSYVAWKLPDSNSNTVALIYLFAGTVLASAGLSDVLLIRNQNPEFNMQVYPIAALSTTLVIFAWTALDMLQRNFQLIKHEAQMRQMIESRNTALQESRSELMQHQRYKALNAMGAAISHEIKNPLGSLSTDIEVLGLKLKSLAPQVNSILDRMRRTAQRIDNIITDLSDFSRKITINITRTDLTPWLHDNLREPEFQALLEAVDFELVTHAEITAKFDPELLRRALINIVENAAHAVSGRSSPRIELSTERQGEYFQIQVKDNGVGFIPVDIHRLCEPMVSGRTTGLGLGLSVARDILILHEGTLELENAADGQGALVTLRVPLDLSPFDRSALS